MGRGDQWADGTAIEDVAIRTLMLKRPQFQEMNARRSTPLL